MLGSRVAYFCIRFIKFYQKAVEDNYGTKTRELHRLLILKMISGNDVQSMQSEVRKYMIAIIIKIMKHILCTFCGLVADILGNDWLQQGTRTGLRITSTTINFGLLAHYRRWLRVVITNKYHSVDIIYLSFVCVFNVNPSVGTQIYRSKGPIGVRGKGQGASVQPIRAFNFRAIIKIGTDAACCIHVSTVLSN